MTAEETYAWRTRLQALGLCAAELTEAEGGREARLRAIARRLVAECTALGWRDSAEDAARLAASAAPWSEAEVAQIELLWGCVYTYAWRTRLQALGLCADELTDEQVGREARLRTRALAIGYTTRRPWSPSLWHPMHALYAAPAPISAEDEALVEEAYDRSPFRVLAERVAARIAAIIASANRPCSGP